MLREKECLELCSKTMTIWFKYHFGEKNLYPRGMSSSNSSIDAVHDKVLLRCFSKAVLRLSGD